MEEPEQMQDQAGRQEGLERQVQDHVHLVLALPVELPILAHLQNLDAALPHHLNRRMLSMQLCKLKKSIFEGCEYGTFCYICYIQNIFGKPVLSM